MSLATYNVRTLFQVGKFDQLTRQAKELPIDIIAVQEHRWRTHSDIDQKWSDDGEFLFIFSSADKNRVGGVGVLVRRKHVGSYRTADKVSDRIIKVYFEGNPMVTFIAAYAPTENADQASKDKFYQDLSNAISSEPPHNILIVLGDFNARIGPDSHTSNSQCIGNFHYHNATNDNGKRLVELCEQTNIRHVQSRFPQPKKKLWTWTHPKEFGADGRVIHAQLDHILVNAKWIRSVTNCRAYNSVELNSDHRILSSQFNIRFRKATTKPSARTKYLWEKLNINEAIREDYKLELKNRFEALDTLYESRHDDPETLYKEITSTVADSEKKYLEIHPRK